MAFKSSKKNPNKDGVTAGYVLARYWKVARRHSVSGILMLLGIVSAGIVGIWTPILYKQFFDTLTSSAPSPLINGELVHVLYLILFINVFSWVAYRIATLANSHFQSMIMADLKQSSYEYLLQHSYTFFANSFTGSLVQRVNRFARAFENLCDRFVWNIIPLVIRLIGAGVVLYFINPFITYAIFAWALIFLAFNYTFSRWKLKYDTEGAAADSKTTAVLADTITNQTTVQLFSGFQAESENFRGVNFFQARLQRLRWNLDALIDAGQAILAIGMEFFLFYFALKYWAVGAISIGVFVLIQVYFIDLVGRLWDFTRVVRDVYQSFADAKEMAEILSLPHDIKDLPGSKSLVVSKGEIEFKDVLFSYNETRTVLDKVNIIIPSGERVALIGPSGAGKSTFIRLLLRLYEPAGGKILIDGQDIEHVTQASLRNNISLVPQDPLLFHRTLLENIRYGRREATDEEVYEAAKLANCDEFATHLPLGYNTYVGERGIKLSGGERQRVAIARAILKNAPILLLDEATSSLDSHSESLIQEALDILMKGKTVLVIAHRLSTIRKMDRILVLDQGHVIESGSHDELLAKDESLYKKLWTLQSGGFLQEDEA